MRIARYSLGDSIRFGTVELAEDGGQFPDTVSDLTSDPLAGPVSLTGERHDLIDVRLLTPVIPRSKILGIGRNYADHAAEFGHDVPAIPLVFLKPNTSVIGPGEPIVRPASSTRVDFEGELAVVIGRICRNVPAERVPDVIFGYTVANDVSARDYQESDGQWARAKGFDTFCPLGPWIVTHLSLEEAGNLEIRTTVNDVVKQDASTKLLMRSITDLIVHVTSFTTLLPGDVILTGTPAGVGPIVPGDRVSVEIAEIGTLTNPVVGEDEPGVEQ